MINNIKIGFWLLIILLSAFKILKLKPKEQKTKKEDINIDNINKNDFKVDME